MKVFAVIRRATWAIILSACVVVSCLYLAFSQAFLAPGSLDRVTRQSHLAQTVRDDILLPKVLASTRSSDYSALLDDKTVTDAFNSAITVDTLQNKLVPAIDAIQGWLDSKQPTVSFSISMSDLTDKFAQQLSEKLNTKIASLPECTTKNPIADAENGVCRSPFITKEALTEKIDQAVKNDSVLKENTTITPESTPAFSSVAHRGTDIPGYLNMFYAVSLVTAGLAGLITLWLLAKHRFAGIVTIGAACVIAAAGLLAVALSLPNAVGKILSDDDLTKSIIFSAVQTLTGIIQNQVLFLGVGGIAAIIIGAGLMQYLSRRRKSHETMHMSSEKRT
jgi:hypothetical protein